MFVSDRGKVHLRWRLENLKIWESPNAPVNWVWSDPPFEGRMSIWKRAKQEGKVVTLFSVTFMSFGVSASSVFVHTKTYLHLPLVGCLRGLGGLAFGARWIAYDARNCTKCNPRRAHNLAQIIVCYNYHSAELRVSGLPKMALWYICTFGLWYIWTLVHLDFGTFGLWHIWTLAHLYLLFSPIVVQMGTLPWKSFQPFLHPIIVQMGDAAIEAFPVLPAPHYRTDGGGCHRHTFQSHPCASLSYKWGRCHGSLSSPSCTPLSYRWGTLP